MLLLLLPQLESLHISRGSVKTNTPVSRECFFFSGSTLWGVLRSYTWVILASPRYQKYQTPELCVRCRTKRICVVFITFFPWFTELLCQSKSQFSKYTTEVKQLTGVVSPRGAFIPIRCVRKGALELWSEFCPVLKRNQTLERQSAVSKSFVWHKTHKYMYQQCKLYHSLHEKS